jgi:hypothetical protein
VAVTRLGLAIRISRPGSVSGDTIFLCRLVVPVLLCQCVTSLASPGSAYAPKATYQIKKVAITTDKLEVLIKINELRITVSNYFLY